MSFQPESLLAIPVFLFALTVHEFAHAWAAKQGGDNTSEYLGRLTLNPIAHIDLFGTIILPGLMIFAGIPPFGWAKPVPVNTLRLRKSIWMVWVALAGPASNILLFLIAAIFLKATVMLGGAEYYYDFVRALSGPEGTAGDAIWYTLGLWLQVNIVLAIFNMTPIPPLDGSRVVYHFFIRHNFEWQKIWLGMEQYGFIIVYVLLRIPAISELYQVLFRFPIAATFRFIHP